MLSDAVLTHLAGYNARRVELLLRQRFAERFKTLKLTRAEFSILMLTQSNEHVTQRELARVLGIPAPNLVKLIAALETRKLIARERDPQDRRALRLVLTAQGQTRTREALKQAEALERDAAKRLSAAEYLQLNHLLRQLLAIE